MANEMEIYRGDDKTWEVTVRDGDGVISDITGTEIVFSVKKNISDTVYLIQRMNAAAGGSSAEIEFIDAPNGVFQIHLVPGNTNALRPSIYTYDIQLILTGKIHTILVETFTVLGEITRP